MLCQLFMNEYIGFQGIFKDFIEIYLIFCQKNPLKSLMNARMCHI